MIYFRTKDDRYFLLVEQGNLDRLRSGKPMVTPDAQFVIHWVPDMPYIEKQVQDFLATGVIPNGEDLVRIIESGKDRPVVKR